MAEQLPVIGTPGDLVVVDPTQYWLVMHRPKPQDTGLAFDVGIPTSPGFQGVVAMPEGYVEQTMSDQQYFSTDSIAFKWKLRADGKLIWPNTLTNVNGATVGPAAICAVRS